MAARAKRKQYERKPAILNYDRVQYDKFGEKFVLCRGRGRNYTSLRLTLNKLSTLEGFTTAEAAKYFGIAPTTFKTCLRLLGITFWCQGRWRHSSQWKAQMLAEAQKRDSCLAASSPDEGDCLTCDTSSAMNMQLLPGDLTELPNLENEADLVHDSQQFPMFYEPDVVPSSMDAWNAWYSNTETSETDLLPCRTDPDTQLCASDNDLSFLCVTEPSFVAPEVLKHTDALYHNGCF